MYHLKFSTQNFYSIHFSQIQLIIKNSYVFLEQFQNLRYKIIEDIKNL